MPGTFVKKILSVTPELVFTDLILQILYWIYKIAFHSYIFMLELPTNIELWNLYYLFVAGKWVVSSLFDCFGKCGNAWILTIYEYQEKKKDIYWLKYILYTVGTVNNSTYIVLHSFHPRLFSFHPRLFSFHPRLFSRVDISSKISSLCTPVYLYLGNSTWIFCFSL
jgi:hypothetical protein